MGLRTATKEIRRDLECAVHSYSQVWEFFPRTPCRLLQWTLLAVGDVWAHRCGVGRLGADAQCGQRGAVEALVDTSGSGNVSPIASEVLALRGVRFTGKYYASRRTGL
jgi:hypothetical protein